MLVTGRPPVRRRGRNGRGRNNRTARIAVPVTAAVALSLGVGVFVAASSGGPAKVHAAAASSSQGVTSSAVNTDCDIIVPAHPLTAKGLATPYQLTGHADSSPGASGCQMINSVKLGAFVQATILDTRTGALSVYDPLVVTKGTRPAVAPGGAEAAQPRRHHHRHRLQRRDPPPGRRDAGRAPPGPLHRRRTGLALRAGVVLQRPRLLQGGLRPRALRAAGHPVRRDFQEDGRDRGRAGNGPGLPDRAQLLMVDQDPSDNVTTAYLLNPATGRTAQATAADKGAHAARQDAGQRQRQRPHRQLPRPGARLHPVGSARPGEPRRDDHVPGARRVARRRYEPKNAALIPENDGMVTDIGGNIDLAKANLYRSEIGQPLVNKRTQASSSPQMFCQNLINIQTPFLAANERVLAAAPSPVPTAGDTLYTFLASGWPGRSTSSTARTSAWPSR